MQQQQLTDLLRFIKNTDSDQSDLAATVLKLAADSITLDTLRSLTGSDKPLFPVSGKTEVSEEEKTGTLSFTKKELESMPKSFQKAFIYDLNTKQETPFIDINIVPNPQFITADPENGDIYIGSTMYDGSFNDVYHFNKSGNLLNIIETGYYTTNLRFVNE